MSISEECTCSLQARLHQVENARSREMKAHGKLVQCLEIELESRRTSEAESRLALAKLRGVNCKLEAELHAAHGKTRQLLELIEAQRVETAEVPQTHLFSMVLCENRFKIFREESDSQLQAACEMSDKLLEEQRQLKVEVSEIRACFENSKIENKVLLAKYEEQASQANTLAADIVKLTSQLTSKQLEIEVATERSQLLMKELTTYQAQHELTQDRIKILERDINRAVVIRNRAFNWRRKRQELWENQLISHHVFLTWKSYSIQAKLQSAATVARCNDDTRARLQLIVMNVLTRCSNAKEELNRVRQACFDECVRMHSLRQEICQTELPKLLTILANYQQSFDSRQRNLEMQLVDQRESFERERERLGMSRQDFEHCVQKTIEDHQENLVFQKRQQHAIFQAFSSRKKHELHHRVFGAWKEFYLRSIVGHATHTAMVFQSKQQQSSTSKVSRSIKRGEPKQWTIPASVQPISMLPQHLQQTLLHSSISEVSTPIDAMWRKWRRVNVGVAGRGRKPLR
ncbi:hypothetical protein P3T76_011463 [Phytophthora citrophthora]|uniref:Uncharacterized protein n=1 Tax=Phytophthora citrophthora TaxID=4793 RepID=A0AAD9G9J9_9STRA|nr:hypothetical protein P3T76_011463 [Phytophthora citrophthora]